MCLVALGVWVHRSPKGNKIERSSVVIIIEYSEFDLPLRHLAESDKFLCSLCVLVDLLFFTVLWFKYVSYHKTLFPFSYFMFYV